STQIFKTDGMRILGEIAKSSDNDALLDFARGRSTFEQMIPPDLFEGVEFNNWSEPILWWPMGDARSVVLDPQRCFGAPIIARSSVPTGVLKAAFDAEQSVEFVARWYDVNVEDVKNAIEFESK